MCGITALLSLEPGHFEDFVYTMHELRNRGYDSVGISFLENEAFRVYKSLGVVPMPGENTATATNMIGHTRWATHGGVSLNNAHPHIDTVCGTLAMVHNGIIENHQELRERYRTRQASETDSEVLLNSIAARWRELRSETALEQSLRRAITDVLATTEGTYGLVFQCAELPDVLLAIRHGSPLVLGTDKDHTMIMISSETQAFPPGITRVYSLPTNELVVLRFDEHFHKDFTAIDPRHRSGDSDRALGAYRHFTEKEILEQQDLIERVSKNFSRYSVATGRIHLGGLSHLAPSLCQASHVYLFGCGTSLHAAMILRRFFLEATPLSHVHVVDATEADGLDWKAAVRGRTVGIFLSQSGETRDLLACLERFRLDVHRVVCLGITNVVGSALSQQTDGGLYTNAGRERGVASTKSFTAQVISGILCVLWFHQLFLPREDAPRIAVLRQIEDLRVVLRDGLSPLFETVRTTLVPLILPHRSLFLLGRGNDFLIAREGALKIKEITYRHAEAYPAGALKHGPFALMDESVLVVFVLTDASTRQESLNSITEILARKTRVVLLTPLDVPEHDGLVVCRIRGGAMAFLVAGIVLQMLAYGLSVESGIDPDFPRNLAKVVTVG
ncbi:SIS domain-containing protein [bacterium]|nr:SIS domain-containing protein [bacterium]